MSKDSIYTRHPLLTLCSVFIISFIVLLSVTEFVLSFTTFEGYAESRGESRAIRLKERSPLSQDVAIPAGEHLTKAIGLEQKEYPWRAEKNGFIADQGWITQPEFKIIFFGGSTTECLYVDEKDRLPAAVANLFRSEGVRVNAYNGGVSGNNVLHSLDAFINKGIPLRPQAVVLMHNINDISIHLMQGGYWNDDSGKSLVIPLDQLTATGVKGWLRDAKDTLIPRTYAAFRTMKRRLTSMFSHGETAPSGIIPEGDLDEQQIDMIVSSYRSAVLSFVRMAKTWCIPPVLLTQGSMFAPYETLPEPLRRSIDSLASKQKISYRQIQDLHARFNDTLRSICAEEQCLLVDLDGRMSGNQDYYYDFVHMNGEGSLAAARLVHDALEPLVKAQ